MQSNLLHSHLQMASADHVAAAMNGFTTRLPAHVDRRFPTEWSEAGLPAYTVLMPTLVLDSMPRYFSWNTPFDEASEFSSSYTYGGTWRRPAATAIAAAAPDRFPIRTSTSGGKGKDTPKIRRRTDTRHTQRSPPSPGISLLHVCVLRSRIASLLPRGTPVASCLHG